MSMPSSLPPSRGSTGSTPNGSTAPSATSRPQSSRSTTTVSSPAPASWSKPNSLSLHQTQGDSDTGNAAKRLRLAIHATLQVADEHLALLAGLFTDDDAIFHETQAPHAPVATADLFVAPFRRLLLYGALDGSLREVSDPTETATVLFNAVGWTYVQLRWTQRWPSDKSRRAIEALVLDGLVSHP